MTKVIIDPGNFETFCNSFETVLLDNIEQRCKTVESPGWFVGEFRQFSVA
jgi:hypothetical protein